MTGEEARRCFEASRVARLATADGEGRPHLVPCAFAVDGDRLVTAVDHKPKRTRALRRLANIEANPAVAVLVDRYTDDWAELWWARADGRARVVDAEAVEGEAAVDLLVARYPQYQDHRPGGPVVVVDVDRWSGWSANPDGPAVAARQPPA